MNVWEKDLRSVPPSAVELKAGFWKDWRRRLSESVLDHVHDQLREQGSFGGFRRLAGVADDCDYGGDPGAHKWLEAASYVLATTDDPELAERVDELVSWMVEAQDENGYLITGRQIDWEPSDRLTNLGQSHELYAAGHLIEGAVAHYEATGSTDLLTVARRFADHLCETFGPDGHDGYPGHPEIEVALTRLYDVTGTPRYLELARFFVDERGREDSRFAWEIEHSDEMPGYRARAHEILDLDDDGEYHGRYRQDHAPIREQETIEGHAVRATYLYAGATDVARETDDEELQSAMERLWENMVQRRMYVTGGIGSTRQNEGFSEDYDLPNETAYCETCAAIGKVKWSDRLLRSTGEPRYADDIERTLYNGFLAGVSLSGDEFFYRNRLASDGTHRRRDWFKTACCPPNAARLLGAIPGYLYRCDDDTFYVSQYAGSRVQTTIADEPISLDVTTDYPWDGTVEIDVGVREPSSFSLALRLPDWCRNPTLRVNGETDPVDDENQFATVRRTWQDGDTVTLTLPMPVETVIAHPAVEDDAGRVALRRGPIVYCLEETDNPRPPSSVRLDPDTDYEATYSPDLLEGVVTVEGEAAAFPEGTWDRRLYRSTDKIESDSASITAIPYYAWANREPGEMRVWTPST